MGTTTLGGATGGGGAESRSTLSRDGEADGGEYVPAAIFASTSFSSLEAAWMAAN